MTILSACQDAAKAMGLQAPTKVYGSTDKFALELSAIANEAAAYIAKAHDWRLLLTLKTLAGNGATTDFTLPTDYDRMPVKSQIFRSSTLRPMKNVLDLDAWLSRRLSGVSSPEGEWILLSGFLSIYPVMKSTESAKFYYCSNKIIVDNGGVPKPEFTADSDSFRLSERVLKLAIKWRWRAMKKLDSADEQEEYEIAQTQEMARDKGSRIFRQGSQHMSDGINLAYPGAISA